MADCIRAMATMANRARSITICEGIAGFFHPGVHLGIRLLKRIDQCIQDEFYAPGDIARISIMFDNIGNVKLNYIFIGRILGDGSGNGTFYGGVGDRVGLFDLEWDH